jgi:hypothetical protein
MGATTKNAGRRFGARVRGLSAAERRELAMVSSVRTATGGTDEYEVTGPDCHNKPAKLQIEFFSVPDNRYIVQLRQKGIKGPSPWSYNPNGGYSIWVKYTKGRTQAEWRRLHTSHPVTYRIFVDWAALES